jgi:F420H(2)-dependent quinone reductase
MANMTWRARNLVARIMGRLHYSIYRATDGRVWGKMLGGPVLLLNTTGRKSGQRRTTPLLYVRDGGDLAIIASNVGASRHPAWYLNLIANPDATVEITGNETRVRAEEASPEEKARLWPKVVEMYSGYEGYKRRTDREIPVVVLHPIGREAKGAT